jgi:hypothetical protein
MKKKLNLKIVIFVIALIFMLILPNFSFATDSNRNVVIILKEAIAMWYYILRLISIAVMLIALIFIGIKMAISTVASDKAYYQRMLADWFVGMILVFGIHYIMIFIIDLNETMVNTIANTANQIYEASPDEYGDNAYNNKTNDDIETSLFDTIRTRAYDPKLINGTTGMIMYIYLVYCAYKFTFIYLKRYLTVAVLTLMAPVVAASYALNKALSGKTQIFTKWLKEYFFNVFLQTIHALIYATFVLMALKLSLNSISGALLALVLLNYMSQADKLFRKIFAFGGGDGSLVDDIANKDVGRELFGSVKGITKAYAGNKVLKAVAKRERKILLKPAKNLFGSAMAYKKNNSDNNNLHIDESGAKTDFEETDFEKFSESDNKKLNKLYELDEQLEAVQRGDTKKLEEMRKAKQDRLNALKGKGKKEKLSRKAIKEKSELSKEIEELDDEIETLNLNDGDEEAKKERILAISSYLNSKQEIAFDKFSRSRLALTFAAKGKLSDAFNADKYVEFDEKKGKYVGLKTKYKGRMVKDENGVLRHQEARKRALWQRWFSEEYEEVDSIEKRIKENINAKTLLGMTEDDKKMLEDHMSDVKNVTVGFFKGLFSMAMIVESPVVGIGLMTSSAASMNKFLTAYNKRNKATYLPIQIEGKTYEERRQSMNAALEEYETNGNLSLQTLKQMRLNITSELKDARDEYIVNDINKKRKKFVRAVLKGTVVVGGGLPGVAFVRSMKSGKGTSSSGTVVRTGGFGYTERENAIKQFEKQDKLNRQTENIVINNTTVDMFKDLSELNIAEKKDQIDSLSKDDTLRQLAVDAGLAVVVGGTLIPLTNEPLTEERILEVLEAKKAEEEPKQKSKVDDEVEQSTKPKNDEEILKDIDAKVNDKLIRDTITKLSKNNNNSVIEFTTNNQEKIIEQLELTMKREGILSDDVSDIIKEKIKKQIEERVTRVKTEMAVAEATTEAFKETNYVDGVKSVDDIKLESIKANVEEKLKNWSNVNVSTTEDGISDVSKPVVEDLNKQKGDLSEIKTETNLNMQIKKKALKGKSVQDLIQESVESRHKAMVDLNSEGASKITEETTQKMKDVLLEKQLSETQQVLADILAERDEEKRNELLEGLSDTEQSLAVVAVEIKRNNQMAKMNGIKEKKHLDYNTNQNANTSQTNSDDVIKQMSQERTRKYRNDEFTSAIENRYNEIKSRQDTIENTPISDGSKIYSPRKAGESITDKTKGISGIDGPLTNVNELLAMIRTQNI